MHARPPRAHDGFAVGADGLNGCTHTYAFPRMSTCQTRRGMPATAAWHKRDHSAHTQGRERACVCVCNTNRVAQAKLPEAGLCRCYGHCCQLPAQ